MKVIIVGGVAGGASCAARLRRLDEKAEILMVEHRPVPLEYANCGLPYHVSGVIPKESSLLVASEKLFREHFMVDARTNCEAISISPKKKTVDLRNVTTGEVTTESFDELGAVAGRSFGPTAPARNRSSWDLPREDRAGHTNDP